MGRDQRPELLPPEPLLALAIRIEARIRPGRSRALWSGAAVAERNYAGSAGEVPGMLAL